MFPFEQISAPPQPAPFLAPDATDTALLESFETGGVALNDASAGRLVQTWRAWVSDDLTSILVSPISGSPITTLVTGEVGLAAVALAFDSNMTPTLAYMGIDGVLKLRWYDGAGSVFIVDTFEDVTSFRLAADDKRAAQEAASDVILVYTRGGNCYRRQQRDRYLVERLVGFAGPLLLSRVGMHSRYRFQIELRPAP